MSDFTVVNTRPAHQAGALNECLQSIEANTINFPTIEIKPINSNRVKTICQQLMNFDIAIFVSANAAYYTHAYWPSPFPVARVIAIGPGTEKAIRQYGIPNIILPQQYNSEGILDLPKLKFLENKKMILFCGKNPKPLLQEALIQQNADVTLCECYERHCPDVKTLNPLEHKKINGIISTSQESLKNLNNLIGSESPLKNIPLIVISPGMENLAKSQGWKKILIAPNASNKAVTKTALKLKSE